MKIVIFHVKSCSDSTIEPTVLSEGCWWVTLLTWNTLYLILQCLYAFFFIFSMRLKALIAYLIPSQILVVFKKIKGSLVF